MQKLARLLTLITVVALGLGPFAPLRAVPAATQPAAMADEMHMAMAGMDAASGKCGPCAEQPGMMQKCLPACITLPALAPQQAVYLASLGNSYEALLERFLREAQSRPDPYPPRATILA